MHEYLPVIKTQRLIIREISESDIYDMYEYAKLPFIGPSAGWEPHPNLSHTKEVIRMFNRKKNYGQLGVFAVVLKDEKKMIGTVELHTYTPNFKAELGYTISPFYWGNGYALEASKALIKWGFDELKLKRIECSCFCDNRQSRRVCEKLGFTYEGLRKNGYMLYNGKIYDLECFAMTDYEYYDSLSSDKSLNDTSDKNNKDISEDISSYLFRHQKEYPKMEDIDLFKLVFQNKYLSGHLLNAKAKDYLVDEASEPNYYTYPLYEYLSSSVIRMNIKPFIALYTIDSLYSYFEKSAIERNNNGPCAFNTNKLSSEVTRKFEEKFKEYEVRKVIPSHSNVYKSLYHPSYRVMYSSYLTTEMKADNFMISLQMLTKEKCKKVIVALEGRCGSGKTTLCDFLEKPNLQNITIIHVDDFFSPNDDEVINEKALSEVLERIKKDEYVTYNAYNCHTQTYVSKTIKVNNIVIVEGVYSYLPNLRKYYDYLFYMVINPREQIKRLAKRETEEMFYRYCHEWIPREEKYFNSYDFILSADVLI